MRGAVTYSVAPPKPESGQMLNDEYVLGTFLGKGAFGTVYECQNVRTGQIFAVKRVPSRRLTPEQKENLVKEVQFLEMLNHPNIVKYICTIRQSDHYNIVLQLMENGSLAQIMKKFGSFSPLLSSIYIRQVLLGLEYLHEHNVIHRDIKGANILSDKYGRVKLADFGVAILKQHADAFDSNDAHLGIGTAYWMAPEVIPITEDQEIPSPTSAYDIWSLGCTVIELLTMSPPWAELNPNAAVARMATQDIPIPSKFSAEICDFLAKCFVRDPAMRCTATQLLEHEWISQQQARSSNLLNAADIARSSNTLVEEDPEFQVAADAATPITPPMVLRHHPTNTASIKMSVTSMNSSASSFALMHQATPPVQPHHQHSVPGQIYDPSPSLLETETPPPSEFLLPAAGGGTTTQQQQQARQSVIRRSMSQTLFPLGENVQVYGGYPQNQQQPQPPQPRSIRLWSITDTNYSHLSAADEYNTTILPPLRVSSFSRFSQFKEQPEDMYFADMTLDDATTVERRRTAGGSSLLALQDNSSALAAIADAQLQIDRMRGSIDSTARTTKADELISKLLVEAIEIEPTCDALCKLFREDSTLKQVLLSHPSGLSPLGDLLSANSTPAETRALLRLVGEVVSNDRAFQELFCMIGLVPILTRLVGKDQELDTRRQAGQVTLHFLQTTPLTLHLFVACGGVQTIIALLESKGESPPSVELALIAVDGVQRIFSETFAPPGSHRRASLARAMAEAERLSESTRMNAAIVVPKNDFCYMFARTPLLDRLAILGQRLQTEEGRKECPKHISPSGFLAEVCHVFSVFSTGAQQIKAHLAHSSRSLRFILQTATSRWAAAAGSTEIVPEDEVDVDMDTVRALLNCLKNLSTEQSCLDALDAAGAIPALISFLSLKTVPSDASLESGVAKRLRKRRQVESIANTIPEVHDVAMVTLYYICHQNVSRQERAAASGIIHCAKSAVQDRTMVKTFALQLLVEMSQGTAFTKNCLYRDHALDFFLDLLAPEAQSDALWQQQILFALSQFVSPGGYSTEFERSIIRPIAIQRILQVLAQSKPGDVDNVLHTILTMLELSPRVCEAMGRCGFLMATCVQKLRARDSSVDTKLLVLKVVDILLKSHSDPVMVLLEHNVMPTVTQCKSKKKESANLNTACVQLLASWNKLLEVQ